MIRVQGTVVGAQLAAFALAILLVSALNRSTFLIAPMTFGATVGTMLTYYLNKVAVRREGLEIWAFGFSRVPWTP